MHFLLLKSLNYSVISAPYSYHVFEESVVVHLGGMKPTLLPLNWALWHCWWKRAIVMACGKTSWIKIHYIWVILRSWVQSICLLFVSWQSDFFCLRYSKFHIWPWKFKFKVMFNVKPDGDIWSLEFNWYDVCFCLLGNWTILAEI